MFTIIQKINRNNLSKTFHAMVKKIIIMSQGLRHSPAVIPSDAHRKSHFILWLLH